MGEGGDEGEFGATAGPVYGGPLPAQLGRRIEAVVERCHRAGRHGVDGGEVFVLPWWLAAERRAAEELRKPALKVYVWASRKPRVSVGRGATARRLATVALSPRPPAAWRRDCITKEAAAIGCDLELALGRSPEHSPWIAQAARAPEVAEQAAIDVWDALLAAADVPRGLRVPGFEASLADLLLVLGGRDGGCDREWFANYWPAAASAILRSGGAEEVFRRMDGNRAAAVGAAAAAFCCQEKSDCGKALALAREFPKHRGDLCLARVLAGHGRRVDVHIRSLLPRDDGGKVLRRMARRSDHAREQAEFAAAAAMRSVFISGECRLAVGRALVSTFAGSGFDPRGLVPATIAHMFMAVSADCLAAFVPEVVQVDKLETGVIGLARVLAADGWRLSPTRLARFAAAACPAGLDPAEWEGRLWDEWPKAPGWGGDDTWSPFAGAAVTVLASQAALWREGETMENCLRTDRGLAWQASAGSLAFFAIRVGDHRATLSVRLRERGGVIESYEVGQLRGPKNAPAEPPAEAAARSVLERLNAGLPAAVSSRMKSAQRRFNPREDVAQERWRRYAALLPKRFRSLSPEEIAKAAAGGPPQPATGRRAGRG